MCREEWNVETRRKTSEEKDASSPTSVAASKVEGWIEGGTIMIIP